MGPRDMFEREAERLDRELEDGDLSPAEFNAEIRELERDYRADAEEDARQAYDDRLEQW